MHRLTMGGMLPCSAHECTASGHIPAWRIPAQYVCSGCRRACVQEDPTAHITQRDVKLPEACAKEYAEYGYW